MKYIKNLCFLRLRFIPWSRTSSYEEGALVLHIIKGKMIESSEKSQTQTQNLVYIKAKEKENYK